MENSGTTTTAPAFTLIAEAERKQPIGKLLPHTVSEERLTRHPVADNVHSEQTIPWATEKREQSIYLARRPTEQDLTPCAEIAPDARNRVAHIALDIFGTTHHRKLVEALRPHAADMEAIIKSVTIHNTTASDYPSRQDRKGSARR